MDCPRPFEGYPVHTGVHHSLDLAAEEPLRFAEPGIVISHRLHTMSEAGDCLIQMAELIAA
jgi:predicted deacylase